MRYEIIKTTPGRSAKPLPVTVRRIIRNGSLKTIDGANILTIRKRTSGSRPATMATQTRFLCEWLNNRYNHGDKRANTIVEMPDFNDSTNHQARISLSDEAQTHIREYLSEIER